MDVIWREKTYMFPDWVTVLTWFLAAIAISLFVYFLDKKSNRGMAFSCIATVLWVGVSIAIHVHNDRIKEQITAETPIFNGHLEPSNEEPIESSIPPNVISLYFGHDLRHGLQILTNSNDLNVLTYRNIPFLTIGKENGKLWISTTISDSQNKTVVTIIKNEFQASPEHAFNPLQPDKHTLIVRDATGTEVLNVRFSNPRRIRIFRANFVLPNSKRLIAHERGLYLWPDGWGLEDLAIDATQSKTPGLIDVGSNLN